MDMKFDKQQILTVTAASLFLVGAIFMLVNTFAGATWSFWVGLGFAIAAVGVYIWLIIENRKIIMEKLTASSRKRKSESESEPESEPEKKPSEKKPSQRKSKNA